MPTRSKPRNAANPIYGRSRYVHTKFARPWQANRKNVFDVFEIDGMQVGVTTKGLRVANIAVKSLAGPTGGII